jgi:4-hydroxy-4-methyl-2-oxoglutarate aldolase
VTDERVARLSKLDSCAVSDALDKLGLTGCVSGIAPLSVHRRIAGKVRTVKLGRPLPNYTPSPPRHLGALAIEQSAPGDIIVVEQRTGIDCGSWGGLLCTGAKLKGVAGVIADGPVRDVDEARVLDFPLFARSATARTARGRIVEDATGVPVMIGDVLVEPGDFVIADSTSIVFIEPADIDRVLDAAEHIAKREALMTKALLEHQPIGTVMGASYEEMLK